MRLLVSLSRRIAADNLGTFACYASVFLIDGLLIAWVATTIAPLADYFMDPTFGRASTVTQKYFAMFAAMHVAPTLETLLILFVGANVIKTGSSVVLYHYQLKFKYLAAHDLSSRCLDAFMKSNLAFFLAHPMGTLQNTLQKESENLRDGVTAMFMTVAVCVQIAILTSVAWALSHTMVIVCVAMVLVFLLVMRALNRWVRQFAARSTATANVVTQHVIESLAGAKLILAYGRGTTMTKRYSDAYRKHAAVAVKSQVLTSAIPVVYQAFGILSVSVALYIAIGRGESLPSLIAALWAMLKLVPMFTQLVTNIANTSNVIPSFEQYNGLVTAAQRSSPVSGIRKFIAFANGVALESVSFAYPGRGRAISNVEISIPKGSFTAFVGESGSGKTTTADILLGLLAPDVGQVCIDNVPFADYDLRSFLDRVGYVQQDSFLFHASVRDNLLWAAPAASEAEIWEALRLANIDDFVRSLPLQLDSVVGDRGAALSGGQRQRIALARALVKKPDILILDEATSALDAESERAIMNSIDAVAPYTTVIVIAHRMSTIARASFVCVFSAGRLVEQGSYAELREMPGGRLRELLVSQHAGLVA